MSVDKPSVRIPKPPQEGSAIIRPTSTVNVNVNVKKTNDTVVKLNSSRKRDDDDDYLTNLLHSSWVGYDIGSSWSSDSSSSSDSGGWD